MYKAIYNSEKDCWQIIDTTFAGNNVLLVMIGEEAEERAKSVCEMYNERDYA